MLTGDFTNYSEQPLRGQVVGEMAIFRQLLLTGPIGHNKCSPGRSLHAFANLDQQLIKRLEAKQAGPRVLNINDYIHNNDRDGRKT